MNAVDSRAVIGAKNNAGLYEAMYASQGLKYERLPYAFVGHEKPPPFYSNLTVLSPDHGDEITTQLKQLATQFGNGMSLKDSFCTMQLEDNGFEVIFNASWIWRDAGTPTEPNTWQRIETEADLALWEQAWKAGGSPTDHQMFNADMLARPEIYFLGQRYQGGYSAGCIANRSDDCVGISNVFSVAGSDTVFAQATAAVAATAPHLPVVGYVSGYEIIRARESGFMIVSDLRILGSRTARF